MSQFDELTKEEQDEYVRLFYDRFAGRLDTYAIRMEYGDRASYMPSNYDGKSEFSKEQVEAVVRDIRTPEFTEDVVRAHLQGRHFIGVYPIRSDSTVRWFALDFDGKNGDPYAEARAQARVFLEEAGLAVYVERSQSGNGYHVWGFLDGEVNAGRLRHALKPFIERSDTFDRMFPNQDGVSETRPLGNLIALPLHGGRVEKGFSSFVARTVTGAPKVLPPLKFLRDIQLIPVTRIDELFEEAGQYEPEPEVRKHEGNPEGLPDGWKVVHPLFGCEWVRWCYENPTQVTEPLWYALACNFTQLEQGRQYFHEWSEQDPSRYNASATDAKYDQALAQNKPHTCESIRELGGECYCDSKFGGKVHHPYDLAKLPFRFLVESIGVDDPEAAIMDAGEGFAHAIQWAVDVEADPSLGKGIPYGIKDLDNATGLRGSDLIIIAARPGMGKTAFMNTIVDNTAMTDVPNYVFSMEMSKAQFWRRQLSTRAGVSQTRMITGQLTAEDWKKINGVRQFVAEPEKYKVFVDDMTRSTERVFEVAGRMIGKYGKGVIWVDYLQLAQKLPGESMFDAVTRIVHDLQLLAKATGCPVIALTQLNRTADDATSESQTFDSWLRGSGDIEQAASVIIFLLGEKGPGIVARIAALHKERHREGGLRFEMQFNQPLMRFDAAGTWNAIDEMTPRRRLPEAEAPDDIAIKHYVPAMELVGEL